MANESPQSDGERSGIPWKWLAMVCTTALVIYLLVSQLAGGEELVQVIQRADWAIAPIALLLQAFTLALATLRWNLILQAMGFFVPYLRAFRVLLATRPFDVMAPSRANDLLRPLGIRDIVPTMQGSGSVLAQRAIDVQSLCMLAVAGGVITGSFKWAALAGVALLGGWSALGLLFWQRRWFLGLPLVERFSGKLESLAVAFVALKDKPTSFLLVSAASVSAWAGALGIVWVLSETFGAGLDPLQILALWPLAIFVGMLPLTVAGMGTRDAAFLSLLALTSQQPVAEAPVLAVTFGYAVVATWVPATLGIPFMLGYMHQLPEARADETDA